MPPDGPYPLNASSADRSLNAPASSGRRPVKQQNHQRGHRPVGRRDSFRRPTCGPTARRAVRQINRVLHIMATVQLRNPTELFNAGSSAHLPPDHLDP
jgi:hypothetical protein